MNGFIESKLSGLDQSPIGGDIRLMPHRDSLLLGINGGSNIFANPFFTDGPRFVQELNVSRQIDFAHEMDATGRNRQVLQRNQVPQVRRQ